MIFPRCLAILGAILGGALGVPVASATVKLPPIFGEHMVLQQGRKVGVWGTADPGESVSVTFQGQNVRTNADPAGKWRVDFAPLTATSDPVAMHIAGPANALDFQDILVGDVWICSGQSNMEFAVSSDHWADTQATANQDRIHVFRVPAKTSLTPLSECEGKWIVCTKENAARGAWNNFSAVGYFFAREIQQARKYPVAMIGAYWGGTTAQAWTDVASLQSDPALKSFADRAVTTRDHLAELKEQYETKTLPAWQKAHDEWTAAYGAAQTEAMAKWKVAEQQALAAHEPLPPQPKPPQPEPRKPLFAADDPSIPASLCNAMIHPLMPYGIKGAIWYQGEANGGPDNAPRYATLLRAMIAGWRQHWGIGDFPFLLVQLPGFGGGAGWPTLRDGQTQILSLPNTGMAVTIDLGEENNIHPKDKVDVGHRLALVARHGVYGEDIVWSGPTFAGMKIEGDAIRVAFNHRGSGLVIGASPAPNPKGEKAAPLDHLVGFEVAGSDGAFVPATARIDGDSVVVTAPGVTTPQAVRYGWKPFPETNLYNREALPAAPFNSASTPVLPP